MRRNQLAFIAQQWREYLGVPASARPYFNHGLPGRNAKESQRVLRVAVGITHHIGNTSRGTSNRVTERLLLRLSNLWGRDCILSQHCAGYK